MEVCLRITWPLGQVIRKPHKNPLFAASNPHRHQHITICVLSFWIFRAHLAADWESLNSRRTSPSLLSALRNSRI